MAEQKNFNGKARNRNWMINVIYPFTSIGSLVFTSCMIENVYRPSSSS